MWIVETLYDLSYYVYKSADHFKWDALFVYLVYLFGKRSGMKIVRRWMRHMKYFYDDAAEWREWATLNIEQLGGTKWNELNGSTKRSRRMDRMKLNWRLKLLPGDMSLVSLKRRVTSMSKIIAIDAGHGDKDSGAIGITGRQEKDFNLQIALKLKQLFLKNNAFEVYLTRETDVFLELSDRAKFANKLKAAGFISIHANKGTDSTSGGFETLYSRAASSGFANTVHSHVAPATSFRNRGVKTQNLAVCRETNMPAILLEAGFLSNAIEEAKLFDPVWQDNYALSIYEGVCDFFNVSPVVQPVDDEDYPKMQVSVNEGQPVTGYNIKNVTWIPSRPIGEQLGAVIGYTKGKVTINGTPVETKLFGNLGYVQVRDMQKYAPAKLFWDKSDPTKVFLYKGV